MQAIKCMVSWVWYERISVRSSTMKRVSRTSFLDVLKIFLRSCGFGFRRIALLKLGGQLGLSEAQQLRWAKLVHAIIQESDSNWPLPFDIGYQAYPSSTFMIGSRLLTSPRQDFWWYKLGSERSESECPLEVTTSQESEYIVDAVESAYV